MKFKLEDKLIEDYLILEMANLPGKKVKLEDLDFSFWFSTKAAVRGRHAIRVKIAFNPDQISDANDGSLELHGDYKWIPSTSKLNNYDAQDIDTARYFFKRYKVLFAAVWEEKLNPDDLSDYFKKIITWEDLLNEFSLPANKKFLILNCKDRNQLEEVVRKYKIFNMND